MTARENEPHILDNVLSCGNWNLESVMNIDGLCSWVKHFHETDPFVLTLPEIVLHQCVRDQAVSISVFDVEHKLSLLVRFLVFLPECYIFEFTLLLIFFPLPSCQITVA